MASPGVRARFEQFLIKTQVHPAGGVRSEDRDKNRQLDGR